MSDECKSNLTQMQTTGKEIAAIFHLSLDPAHIAAMSADLLVLSQSLECHECRMMILGALAALGHGTMMSESKFDS